MTLITYIHELNGVFIGAIIVLTRYVNGEILQAFNFNDGRSKNYD